MRHGAKGQEKVADRRNGRWHRCNRWWKRGLECPFDAIEEHEEEPDEEDKPTKVAPRPKAIRRAIEDAIPFEVPIEIVYAALAATLVGRALSGSRTMGAAEAKSTRDLARVLQARGIPLKEGTKVGRAGSARLTFSQIIGAGSGFSGRTKGRGGFHVNTSDWFKRSFRRPYRRLRRDAMNSAFPGDAGFPMNL